MSLVLNRAHHRVTPLALLRGAWKDRPKQLEPFLEDNRKIRNHLPVR